MHYVKVLLRFVLTMTALLVVTVGVVLALAWVDAYWLEGTMAVVTVLIGLLPVLIVVALFVLGTPTVAERKAYAKFLIAYLGFLLVVEGVRYATDAWWASLLALVVVGGAWELLDEYDRRRRQKLELVMDELMRGSR